MVYKMAKSRIPEGEELERCSKLCSEVLGVEAELAPFDIHGHMPKTRIFGGNIHVQKTQASTKQIPSTVIVKRYIPGVQRTSEDIGVDTARKEFTKERAILNLNIIHKDRRIYPSLYSFNHRGCDENMIIIREYVHGTNLEQIAEKQLKEGEIKWETVIGTPAISDAFEPMSVLHVQGRDMIWQLNQIGLLPFETIEQVEAVEIAADRANKFVRYCEILARGLGKEIVQKDVVQLKDDVLYLDWNLVSRKDLLTIVDGELDVFPHHVMADRLLDAGGVEIGGFIRGYAIYSAPAFKSKWKKPENMPSPVLKTGLSIRGQIEQELRQEVTKFGSNELLETGILWASVHGNTRKSAAIVHYNGRDIGYPVDEETSKYLSNAVDYQKALIGVTNGEFRRRATRVNKMLQKYGLDNPNYKLVNSEFSADPAPKVEVGVSSRATRSRRVAGQVPAGT